MNLINNQEEYTLLLLNIETCLNMLEKFMENIIFTRNQKKNNKDDIEELSRNTFKLSHLLISHSICQLTLLYMM